MNGGFILIISIISACIGGTIGVILFHKPIKIEFKIFFIDSFLCAFGMFFVMPMVMVLEFSINCWNTLCFKPTNWWLILLSSAIDGGLLIAIALPLLSVLFSKWIMKLNLDLCIGYSINAVKIYYSAVIVANCIWFLIWAGFDVADNSLKMQSIVNRIIIWMLNVVGTWAGIGFHCEGRISEELKNIKKSKEKKNAKEILLYSIPFVIAFIVNCLLLLVQLLDVKWILKIFQLIYCVVLSGMFTMLVLVWIIKCIEYPSEKRSNRKLAKAISKINEKKIINERYQTIQYALINEKYKKYLLICERDVIWVGHEEEVCSYFGERKEPVETFDYEECKKYLIELLGERREFVKKGYVLCKEDMIKQLLRQNQE
jgi:hypothetical protein